MKKRNIFFLILTIIGVALFVFLVQSIGWDKIKEAFTMFTWWQFVILVVSFFIWLIFISRSTMVILKAFGHRISFKKMYPLVCIAFSVGYVTPVPYTGGEPVQVYLMYKRNHVPISAATTAVILERVTRQIMALLVILAGVVLGLATVDMSWITRFILIGLMAFFLFVLWAYFAKSISGEGFLQFMIRFLHLKNLKIVKKPKAARVIQNIDRCTTNFLTSHGKPFWISMGYATLSTAIMVGQLILVLYFMGYKPTLSGVLLLYMFTNLVTLIPTPAMLGTYEAGGMAVFAIEGLGAGFGLVFSLIMRIANVFAILPGLFMLPYYGLTIREAVVNGKGLRKKVEDLVPINQNNLNKTPLDNINHIFKNGDNKKTPSGEG